MKPTMLFVDDRSKRIHAILQNATGFDVTIATNVREALRLMSAQDFTVVSLDHDLNGCDFEDPDSPTCGMEIVRYLEKTGWPSDKERPDIWVHSKNLFAAHLMETRLQQMGFRTWYKPFNYDQKIEHFQYDEHGVPK